MPLAPDMGNLMCRLGRGARALDCAVSVCMVLTLRSQDAHAQVITPDSNKPAPRFYGILPVPESRRAVVAAHQHYHVGKTAISAPSARAKP
jgi:hypothetical protein